MLKEVLVVEGKADRNAIERSPIEADCIILNGFHFNRRTLHEIDLAYQKRGLIILTDPDTAGESIRRFLSKKFPNAKQAYISREKATANNDVGVEHASPEDIIKALGKIQTVKIKSRDEFCESEMIILGLSGGERSSKKRRKICDVLGIGQCNSRNLVRRLNNYGITRTDFEEALKYVSTKNK